MTTRALGTSARAACEEGTFRTWDGAALAFRAWRPERPPFGGVILLHRGHEHSTRWEGTAQSLCADNVAVFAFDARGHGGSAQAPLGPGRVSWMVRDLDRFARFVSDRYGITADRLVVVGHSIGAVTAAAWVHDYAPPVRGLVLAAPAFKVRLYVPLAWALLRGLAAVRPGAHVPSYVTGRWLTHDPEEARRYDSDPAITRSISVSLLVDLRRTANRLINDAAALRTPTLVLLAGDDRVVDGVPARRYFAHLSSPDKKLLEFPGFAHSLFHEERRKECNAALRAFVRRALRHGPESATSRPEATPTRSETGAVRRAGYLALKAAMKTLGPLSDGVRLGWRAGFDSGPSLDYVYRNRASGVTPFGRWIDRVYLDSAGWRGIRQRRANLERMVRSAIRAVHGERRPVRILDIAAGAGRYVLETLAALREVPAEARLRDRDPASREAARRLAIELGLSNVRVEPGDAFARAELAAIEPKATVAIASGLYELFGDNDRVRLSLAGVRAALEEGGYLIYTNQPWHPQRELIAHVLLNREGRPWIMRCRPQAEMDALVHDAGFRKLDMEIDDDGIFTVSIARKEGS